MLSLVTESVDKEVVLNGSQVPVDVKSTLPLTIPIISTSFLPG